MLPETQFCGHPEEYKIVSLAQDGDGAAVWTTLSQNSLRWNPEQKLEDDHNNIHIQCRKNVKLIDEVVKECLKSVILVITSLLRSLHDTVMDGLNKGFKVALDKFEKIIDSGEKIFKNTNTILEILLEGHHNIIVMVGAGTMSVLVILVLAQTSYMMKLTKEIKKKEAEADKKVEEV